MRTVFVHSSFIFIMLLLANIDISIMHLGAAINEACRDGKSDLNMRLIESDIDIIDLNRLIKIAFDRNWLDIVKWSIENIDNNFFDMKDVMNKAYLTGKFNRVKWLIEHFDNKLFDMKEAINNALGRKTLTQLNG